MSTIRIKHTNKYTQIANATLQDSRLSWKARGLLCYLLSFPDNWQVNIKQLANASDRDGKSAVESGLKELRDLGYLAKVAIRNNRGQISHWEAQLRETPDPGKSSDWKIQDLDSQNLENPGSGEAGAILNNVLDQECLQEESEDTHTPPQVSPPDFWEPEPEAGTGQADPSSGKAEQDSLVDNKTSGDGKKAAPPRVEVLGNNPDDHFLNGNRNRREYRQAQGQRNAINPEVFPTVEDYDDFWKKSVARLRASSQRLNKDPGSAEGIASAYCRQVNTGDRSNPAAWEYYRLWQRGEMSTPPVQYDRQKRYANLLD